MKKMIISLLSILLMIGIWMPISAEDSAPITASDLEVGYKIIMGEYNGSPIQWRVLGTDGSSTRLISEYILFKSEFGDSNNYEASDIRTYLTGYFLKNFTIEELSYVEKTTYITKNFASGSYYNLSDEFFLLSADEVGLKSSANNEGSNIGFGSDEDRIAYLLDSNSDTGDCWWLRTAYSSFVRFVLPRGSLGGSAPSYSFGVRPACHIKSNTPVYLWTDDYYRLYPELISISLNETSKEMNEGEEFELVVSYNPTEVREEDKGIVWSSSDPTIVTVDTNGKVTALKEGTVTITATSEYKDTITASCTIKISAKQTTPTDPDDDKPSSSGGNKPSNSRPSYDPDDTNKDGVVTCEEKFGSGWIWSEDHKACIRQEWVIVDTSTK